MDNKAIEKRIKKYLSGNRLLEKSLKEYILRGGKRIRAYLVYETYKSHSKDDRFEEGAMDVASAMELFHAGLLIHDDWMDEDELRRGKETLHVKFSSKYGKKKGENLAILAGDLAITTGFLMISRARIKERIKNNVIDIMSEIIGNVTYGQSLDIIQDINGIKDIEKINFYKTATYSFIGPIKIGLMLAEKNDENLIKAGKYAGIAFQMQDDLIDIMSDKSGKDIGSDIKEGKINYTIHYILEHAKKRDREYIKNILGKEIFDIGKVREIIRNNNIDNMVIGKINKNISIAEKLAGKNSYFIELLERMRNRSY